MATCLHAREKNAHAVFGELKAASRPKNDLEKALQVCIVHVDYAFLFRAIGLSLQWCVCKQPIACMHMSGMQILEPAKRL